MPLFRRTRRRIWGDTGHLQKGQEASLARANCAWSTRYLSVIRLLALIMFFLTSPSLLTKCILIAKMLRYGLVWWLQGTWKIGWTSGCKVSNWLLLHHATVGPVLLKISINNLDDRNEWDALCKFQSRTKCRVIVILQSNATILNKLETWCGRNLVKFNNSKCQLLQPTNQKNPKPTKTTSKTKHLPTPHPHPLPKHF